MGCFVDDAHSSLSQLAFEFILPQALCGLHFLSKTVRHRRRDRCHHYDRGPQSSHPSGLEPPRVDQQSSDNSGCCTDDAYEDRSGSRTRDKGGTQHEGDRHQEHDHEPGLWQTLEQHDADVEDRQDGRDGRITQVKYPPLRLTNRDMPPQQSETCSEGRVDKTLGGCGCVRSGHLQVEDEFRKGQHHEAKMHQKQHLDVEADPRAEQTIVDGCFMRRARRGANAFVETFFVNVEWIPSGLYYDVIYDIRIMERLLEPTRELLGGGVKWVANLVRSRASASAAPASSPKESANSTEHSARSKAKNNGKKDAKKKAKKRPQLAHSALGDRARLDLLMRRLETLPEPFYVHLHLVETHVAPDTPQEAHDRTIRAADDYFRELIGWLEQRGTLENSIVIISSDHTHHRDVYERVPLMIYFPNEEHTGVVDANVQLLDIAPTVLDYMGQPIPDWMEGQSLLFPDSVAGDRSLYGFFDRPVTIAPPDGAPNDAEAYVAPIGVASLVRCDQWFYYSIPEARILSQGVVETDQPSCESVTPLTEPEGQLQIERYLEKRGVTGGDMPPSSTKLL